MEKSRKILPQSPCGFMRQNAWPWRKADARWWEYRRGAGVHLRVLVESTFRVSPTHYSRWHPCKSQEDTSKSQPANTEIVKSVAIIGQKGGYDDRPGSPSVDGMVEAIFSFKHGLPLHQHRHVMRTSGRTYYWHVGSLWQDGVTSLFPFWRMTSGYYVLPVRIPSFRAAGSICYFFFDNHAKKYGYFFLHESRNWTDQEVKRPL